MEEIQRLFGSKRRHLVPRQPGENEPQTVGQYGPEWLKRVQPMVAPKTYRSYEGMFRVHLEPALGPIRLRDLTRSEVKGLIAAKLQAGLARNTVRLIRATLHAMMNDAVEDELVDANPAALPRSDRREARKRHLFRLAPTVGERQANVKALTREQLQRLLEAARARVPSWYPMFYCMARTGMRSGEAIALQRADVDHEQMHIDIRRGFSEGLVGPTKSRKPRRVDMSRSLQEVLREQETRVKELALRRGRPAPEWIFPAREGRIRNLRNLERAFEVARAAAGLPEHLTPHCLRHTFSTLLLEQGESIEYVAQQLGDSIEVTAQVYDQWARIQSPGAVDRLDRKNGLDTRGNGRNFGGV